MVTFSPSVPHRPRAHRSHHDSRSRRTAKSEASSRELPERRVHIELVDLDDLRDPIKIGIRRTSQLSHVTAFLKQRYHDDDDDEPVSKDAQILYYWLDKCLLGDEIPSGISTLHYRAVDCSDGDGDDGGDDDDDACDDAVQIIWSSRVRLEMDVTHQLRSDIKNGETIGGLRRTLASLLNVKDLNRIVISARGGLRPGLLQGNNWKVSKIGAWLCRKIWVDVAPTDNYIILKGVNEEYIYHPPLAGDGHSIDFRTLRNWLLFRIITNVHHRASSRLRVDADDVALICKGRVLNKRGRIPLRQTVYFELTRGTSDRFVAEEAWLVPQTESCLVCGDDKRVSEMPGSITKSCEHEPTTCKECVGQWISSSMDTLAWDRLKCPECPEILSFADVRAFAGREIFARYDTLAMKAAVASIHDFKWCLNPRCGSGQIVRPGCEKIRCHSCQALSCGQHDVPWHKGETCDDYDRRTRRQRKGERASEKKVKEITKACPECHKDVYKFSGCDHITCVCGHEWCYICLEAYYRDRNSFLQCKHKKECKYFENPPNYEGGRAFMPFLNPANWDNQDGGFRAAFRPRPHQPRFGQWPPRPIPPPNHNPFQPDPVPDPPADDEAQPARARPETPPEVDADPFQFLMRDFLARDHQVHFNFERVRRDGAENDFLDAATRFTMEQIWQRAR
ncbi:E3 ubiquitin-protein ligase RNF19B [Seiridium cupressi]